jgi:hypothetical protein
MEKSEYFMGVNRLATAVIMGQAGQSNPHISVQQATTEQFFPCF